MGNQPKPKQHDNNQDQAQLHGQGQGQFQYAGQAVETEVWNANGNLNGNGNLNADGKLNDNEVTNDINNHVNVNVKVNINPSPHARCAWTSPARRSWALRRIGPCRLAASSRPSGTSSGICVLPIPSCGHRPSGKATHGRRCCRISMIPRASHFAGLLSTS